METQTLLSNNLKKDQVFKTLLRLQQGQASLIAKHANLPKSSVYRYLEELIDEGFCGFELKDNKKIFFPAPPKIIERALDQKLKNLISKNRQTLKIVKKSINQNQSNNETHLKVLKGPLALWNIFEEISKSDMDSYNIGAASYWFNSQSVEYFRKNVTNKRRQRSKTKAWIISDKHSEIQRIQKDPDLNFREVKILPEKNKTKSWLYCL